MMREEYLFWLGNIRGIGPVRIDELLQVFSNAEEIFKADKKELIQKTSLKETEINTLLDSRNEDNIRKGYAELQRKNIQYLTKEDNSYPKRLRHIYQAPFGLYVKGKIPGEDRKALAVIGARECTGYGREIARYLSGAIAREGIDIISGFARGIDSYAHLGALDAGGSTYGILGCGIDICYPRENLALYMEMQKECGILSEFPLGTAPHASNFPMRNRIISGLSNGILVIEAKSKSGSLITVDIGLEQGKEIYAIPGRIMDQSSAGCNNLIKMGAKLVTSPQDILEDLLTNSERRNVSYLKRSEASPVQLTAEEKLIYDTLGLEPKHLEEILLRTKLSSVVLMELLLNMEMQGLVRQVSKNYYIVNQMNL